MRKVRARIGREEIGPSGKRVPPNIFHAKPVFFRDLAASRANCPRARLPHRLFREIGIDRQRLRIQVDICTGLPEYHTLVPA